MIAVPKPKSSDIRIKEMDVSYEDFPYRTPYEFGGRSGDRVTLLNVHCTVETVAGHVAKGFGSMPMGNEWSFPSRTLSYDTTGPNETRRWHLRCGMGESRRVMRRSTRRWNISFEGDGCRVRTGKLPKSDCEDQFLQLRK
jgi:hypothetical protein